VKSHSRALATIGVGASKILGVQRIFARIAQTSPKSCATCLQIFSHKDHELKAFFGEPSEKAFICFYANVGRQFF